MRQLASLAPTAPHGATLVHLVTIYEAPAVWALVLLGFNEF